MDGKYLLHIQVILIALQFALGSLHAVFKNPILAIPFFVATIIALSSGHSLGLKSYSPFPTPSKNNKLVTGGFYKYVRHPIYTAVMIVALVLLLSNPTFPSFVIFAVLIYIQDIKASLEEEFLTKLHPAYKNYTEKTKKFIPKIY